MNTPTGPRERQRAEPQAQVAQDTASDTPTPSLANKEPPGGTAQTITLHVPKTLGGVYTTELTIRRPTVRDRMNVSRTHRTKTLDEQELIFIGNLTDLMPDEVEALDYADYTQLQDALSSFTSTGR